MRTGMGCGVGRRWVSCVILCRTAFVIAGVGRGPPCCLSWEKGMVVRFKAPLEIPISHCHKCQLSRGPLVFEG